MITVFIAGMGMMQGMAASNTVIQTIVTDDKRGRVMSYYTMAFMGMAPFGSLLAGTMAHTSARHDGDDERLGGSAGRGLVCDALPALRRQIRPIYPEMGILRRKACNCREEFSNERRKSELTLEPRRTAIVVIDLQKGIAGMPGGAPHAKPAVIANTARLLAAARAAGAQPVLVHVGGAPDGADRVHTKADQGWSTTRRALPPDWSELIPELNQQPGDIVMLKRQWGAFYGTDLDLQLRRRA